jgi:hypothetical protein
MSVFFYEKGCLKTKLEIAIQLINQICELIFGGCKDSNKLRVESGYKFF